ncbi:zinc finger protein 665-like [Penaeus japonicus]|uniref:zinc finger protein 665-like n=1 Tax=Penaeus japonicus TaxID=27405 RepID=UPI001C716AAC|nr:zinc finger protein 665-like [Penaeus japonicus]
MMHRGKIFQSNSPVKSEATVKLEQADGSDYEPKDAAEDSKGRIRWDFSHFPSAQENSMGQPKPNRTGSHLTGVKSESGEYTCNICGLDTGTAFRLRRHSKLHAKEKTYHCPCCGPISQQAYELKEHACISIDGKLYNCGKCFSKFSQKSSLKNHMKIHNRIKEFICEECPAAFVSHQQLKVHTMKHTGGKFHHDQECGDGFATTTRLRYHKVAHTGERPYECKVCGESFREKTTLTSHKSVHLTRGPYRCNMCGEAFPRINSLTLHQRVHQTDSTYNYVAQNCKLTKKTLKECGDILYKDTQNENNPPVREENSNQKEKCEGSSLDSRSVPVRNSQGEIPISSTNYTMTSPKGQGEKHSVVGNVSNVPHPDIVEEALTTGTLLESQGEDGQIYLIVLPRTIAGQDYTHITLPSKMPSVTESVYQQNQGTEENDCNLLMWDNELDLAEVSFKPDSEILQSEQHKSKEKCGDENSSSKEVGVRSCNKKLVSARVRQKEKSKQKKVYTYDCKSCGKKCKNSSSYAIHMRTHTGERPYYCGFCGVGFKQVSHLKSHIRIHTGEKPYKCSQCDAAFNQSSQLRAHCKVWHQRKLEIRREKEVSINACIRNFYCKICNKTFVNSCFKKQHMKTHIDELQYMCNKCEATFKTKNRLQRHELLHIHDNFKICELCGLHFKDLSSLNHHRFAIHDLSKQESDVTKYLDDKKLSGRDELSETIKGGDSSGSVANSSLRSMIGKEQSGGEGHALDDKKSSENIQAHPCKICKKIFKQKTNLNTHMRVHTDERPYKCDECGSAFHQISHLKDHAKLHSGEKPFKCSECLALFVQSSAAKTHIKKHHGGQACVIKDKRTLDFLARESIVLQEIPKGDDDNTVVIKIEKDASVSVEVERESNMFGIIKEDKKDVGIQNKDKNEGSVHQESGKSTDLHLDCKKNISKMEEMEMDLPRMSKRAANFCTLCQKTFRRASALKFHVKMAHENRKDKEGNIVNAN